MIRFRAFLRICQKSTFLLNLKALRCYRSEILNRFLKLIMLSSRIFFGIQKFGLPFNAAHIKVLKFGQIHPILVFCRLIIDLFLSSVRIYTLNGRQITLSNYEKQKDKNRE